MGKDMVRQTKGIVIVIVMTSLQLLIPEYNIAASLKVPAGFEDIFSEKKEAILNIIYGDKSVGSIAVEFNQESAQLLSPQAIADRLSSVDMPRLTISPAELVKKLSHPLKRTGKQGFADKEIVVNINESDSSLHLILPASLIAGQDNNDAHIFVPYQSKAGFVHSHNLNYLSDAWGDSMSFASTDLLNLTGNSYVKSVWSYSQVIDFELDELALYLEHQNVRSKFGRQRLNDNLTDSTPSLSYSFFNPVSIDGASLGYLKENYLTPSSGAASPVSVYLPQAGTVEIYRSGKLIDLQPFPAGMHYLNTESWPTGGYDVVLISKLSNGSQQQTIQPFYKRSGAFRSGDIEYLVQYGRYRPETGITPNRYRSSECFVTCDNQNDRPENRYRDFGGLSLGYTTESAISLGGGIYVDDHSHFSSASSDIPLNLFIAERLSMDGSWSQDGSRGYQVGISKSYSFMGVNASYRDYRYRGDEAQFRSYGVLPKYDFSYVQFGGNTFLPGNIGLSVNYGLNTFYQDYGRRNPTHYKSWDVNLNRDFLLTDAINMRIDLGYHRGKNTYVSRSATSDIVEDKLFLQFTLGLRERSYNHAQSLYLKGRYSDQPADNNTWSGNYTLNLNNPDFDRGGKYTINAGVERNSSYSNSSAGAVMDNRFGYTSAGLSRSFSGSDYHQAYLSQRGGFAVGDSNFAFGRMNNNAALIVDASSLPEDQFFEVRNRNVEPVVIKGGTRTTLAIMPYRKIDPEAEQLFTGKADSFYNLSVQAPRTTWVMPGQAMNVRLSATRNLTVTGRLKLDGQPVGSARVVGGNTSTDDEGYFVGDFTLELNQQMNELNVKRGEQELICPLSGQNVRFTSGIMQVSEVNCHVK